jgi:hypothetical protein
MRSKYKLNLDIKKPNMIQMMSEEECCFLDLYLDENEIDVFKTNKIWNIIYNSCRTVREKDKNGIFQIDCSC